MAKNLPDKPQPTTLIKRHTEGIAHNTIGNYLTIKLMEGVPYIVTWFTAHLAYLRGLGTLGIVLLSVAVFALLSFGVNQFSLLISRRRQHTIGAGQEPALPSAAATEPDATTRAGYERLIGEQKRTIEQQETQIERYKKQETTHSIQLAARDGEIEQLKARYEGLHNIANYQKQHLRKFVLVERCIINSSYLAEGKLYLDFIFAVVNLSMYSVSLMSPEGAVIEDPIHHKGEPLSGTAKLLRHDAWNIAPTKACSLTIRQWVNANEAEDIAETLKQRGNLFNFAKATVSVSIDGLPDVRAKLDLTRGMQTATLENKVIELGNENTELKAELASRQERAPHIEQLTLALGACYQAYNQLEHRELLTEEAFGNLKMRIGYALASRPDEPKEMGDFYDELPPVPDSLQEQKAWVDEQCFRLRALIVEQRSERLVVDKAETPKQSA